MKAIEKTTVNRIALKTATGFGAAVAIVALHGSNAQATPEDQIDADEFTFITGKDDYNILLGNSSKQKIVGQGYRDIIFARAGDDILIGGGGDDWLNGEWDDDRIYGGKGQDLLVGGLGSDILHGGEGFDVFYGGNQENDGLVDDGVDTAYLEPHEVADPDKSMPKGDIENIIEIPLITDVANNDAPEQKDVANNDAPEQKTASRFWPTFLDAK